MVSGCGRAPLMIRAVPGNHEAYAITAFCDALRMQDDATGKAA